MRCDATQHPRQRATARKARRHADKCEAPGAAGAPRAVAYPTHAPALGARRARRPRRGTGAVLRL